MAFAFLAAAAPTGNGVIAYSFVEQRPGGRSWVELVRPDGSHRRRFPCTTGSFDACRDHGPAFSPDGTRLAVLNGSEIVIARVTGEVLQRIPETAATVAWSPEGRRLALTQSHTDPPAPVRHAVYVLGLGGGSPRQVPGTADVEPFGLSWSARGLLAWEKRGRRAGIYVSDPRGENRRRVVPTQGPPHLPRWSYDGRRLAYACGSLLCAVRPDGTAKRLLTRRCAMEFEEPGGGMAWSPDGRQVACSGRAFADLITVRLGTGERRIVRRRPSSASFLPFEIAWRARAGAPPA